MPKKEGPEIVLGGYWMKKSEFMGEQYLYFTPPWSKEECPQPPEGGSMQRLSNKMIMAMYDRIVELEAELGKARKKEQSKDEREAAQLQAWAYSGMIRNAPPED